MGPIRRLDTMRSMTQTPKRVRQSGFMTSTEQDLRLKLHHEIAGLEHELSAEVRDATMEIYSGVLRESVAEEVTRDIAYGDHPRHLLDVHQPITSATGSLPVFCFVHGGGFVRGDKNKKGQPYYDNVASWAAASGFLGVNATYRLAPEFTYPAASYDVASALAWIGEHAQEFGGDPAKVVVMGHSSGAAHVATFVALPEMRESLRFPPAGAVLSSGVYDPSIGPNTYSPYYGDDPALLASRSSIDELSRTDIPLLVSSAEFDPPATQRQTLRLIDAIGERSGKFPHFVQADGHNHYSVMYQFGTSETWYTDRLQRFVMGVSRRAGSQVVRSRKYV